MPHVYSWRPRVCSLQDGNTPLLLAMNKSSPSLGIVEVLLQKKADVNATQRVTHLEDSRCAACILMAPSCVFVAGRLESSAVCYEQAIVVRELPGHRGGPGEGEGGREREKPGEAFGG